MGKNRLLIILSILILNLSLTAHSLAMEQNVFCLPELSSEVLVKVNETMLGGQSIKSLVGEYSMQGNFNEDGRKTGILKVWMMDDKLFQETQTTFIDKGFAQPLQFITLINHKEIWTNQGQDFEKYRKIRYLPKKYTYLYYFENMFLNRTYNLKSFSEKGEDYIVVTNYSEELDQGRKYFEEATYYIDKETYLIKKIEVYEERLPVIMKRTYLLEDYLSIDGMKMPIRIKSTTYFNDEWIADEEAMIENVHINTQIPAEIFLP